MRILLPLLLLAPLLALPAVAAIPDEGSKTVGPCTHAYRWPYPSHSVTECTVLGEEVVYHESRDVWGGRWCVLRVAQQTLYECPW